MRKLFGKWNFNNMMFKSINNKTIWNIYDFETQIWIIFKSYRKISYFLLISFNVLVVGLLKMLSFWHISLLNFEISIKCWFWVFCWYIVWLEQKFTKNISAQSCTFLAIQSFNTTATSTKNSNRNENHL